MKRGRSLGALGLGCLHALASRTQAHAGRRGHRLEAQTPSAQTTLAHRLQEAFGFTCQLQVPASVRIVSSDTI
eukprot:6182579-Pleurochrysis_carterae.AAC.2